MKKSRKVIIAVVLSAVVVGAGVTAYAKRSGFCYDCTPQEKAAWFVQKAGDRLDLDQEQSAKLDELAQYLLQLRQQVREDHTGQREQLLALIAAPALDQQQVLEMVSEKTQLVDDNAPEVIAKVAQFTDSLNAEQKDELLETLEWHHSFRHHH